MNLFLFFLLIWMKIAGRIDSDGGIQQRRFLCHFRHWDAAQSHRRRSSQLRRQWFQRFRRSHRHPQVWLNTSCFQSNDDFNLFVVISLLCAQFGGSVSEFQSVRRWRWRQFWSLRFAYVPSLAHIEIGSIHAQLAPSIDRHVAHHGQRGRLFCLAPSLHFHIQVRYYEFLTLGKISWASIFLFTTLSLSFSLSPRHTRTQSSFCTCVCVFVRTTCTLDKIPCTMILYVHIKEREKESFSMVVIMSRGPGSKYTQSPVPLVYRSSRSQPKAFSLLMVADCLSFYS